MILSKTRVLFRPFQVARMTCGFSLSTVLLLMQYFADEEDLSTILYCKLRLQALLNIFQKIMKKVKKIPKFSSLQKRGRRECARCDLKNEKVLQRSLII